MSTLHPLAKAVEHPSPLRHRAPVWLVLVGLFAAPIAWLLQLLVSYEWIGDRCTPSASSTPSAVFAAGGVLALAVALVGIAAAYRTWRRTREEAPGDHHKGLTTGAGRTRFLGLCGLVASATFTVAAVFELLVPFLGSPCPPL